MATTLTLQNSMNFVAPLLKNQQLAVSGFDPALPAGNIVLATMLGAPFKWRFNRKEISFPITQIGGTDYMQAIAVFGFLETQWLLDGSGNYYAMSGATSLAIEGKRGRPEKVAPQFDDNSGNITFRFDKLPDQNYTAYIDFQQKAPLLISPASEWAPVPDEFNHVFNLGFLCLMSLLVNDSRFPIFENYFISRLLGLQDGLTDQERNIFVGNWTALTATLKRADGLVGSGIAGRAK